MSRLRAFFALFGVLGALCLGGCVVVEEGVQTTSVGYQGEVYDSSVTYFAVAEDPGRLYFFQGGGCGYPNFRCASFVSVRAGYWPSNVNYYSTTTNTVITHDRWVNMAGGHGWNHGVLQGHHGWSHGPRGPAMANGGNGGPRNVNHNANNGGRGNGQQVVNHDGHNPHAGVPATGGIHRNVNPGPAVVPQRVANNTPAARPAVRTTPATRACGGRGQPRC